MDSFSVAYGLIAIRPYTDEALLEITPIRLEVFVYCFLVSLFYSVKMLSDYFFAMHRELDSGVDCSFYMHPRGI